MPGTDKANLPNLSRRLVHCDKQIDRLRMCMEQHIEAQRAVLVEQQAVLQAQQKALEAITAALVKLANPPMIVERAASQPARSLARRGVTRPDPASDWPEDGPLMVEDAAEAAQRRWEAQRIAALAPLPDDHPQLREAINRHPVVETDTIDTRLLPDGDNLGLVDDEISHHASHAERGVSTMAELAAEAEELGLYETEALPPVEPSDEDVDRIWQGRMKMHAMRLWQPEWGPRPGEAGCLVPAHLLPRRR